MITLDCIYHMHWSVSLLIAILIVIYISYYYRYPKEVAILQNRVSDIDMSVFLQKQPIVIEDQVVELETLAAAWFKLCFKTKKELTAQTDDTWSRNRYKYLVLQPNTKAEVMLYPPGKPMNATNDAPPPEETLLVIKLAEYQPIILPMHWRYRFFEPHTQYHIIGVHDWLSWILP